ncbi:MAG: hypothetical protein KF886_02305 [Candidatus Hydrogenedentes bacterium]|nr:hypothetical protein [Candidatus Hydrogenedentota bacterium]
MTKKYLAIAALLCLVLFVGAVCLDMDTVQAQSNEFASKTGLGNKEFDKQKLPGKLEVSLGVGSIFVMIAVLKYL